MIKELVPPGSISVPDFNQKYNKECRYASSFIHCLEHAMQKTGDYEEAMHQLRCIGWPDCQETLLKAVEVYRQVLKGKLETGPHGSEFRHVMLCKNCKFFMEYTEEYKSSTEGADGDCYIRVMNSEDKQFCSRKHTDFCSDGKPK